VRNRSVRGCTASEGDLPESAARLNTYVGDFEIETELCPPARVVSIRGEFDIAHAEHAKRVLEDAAADRAYALVVDLTGCAFIDSAGLSTILAVARQRADEASVAVAAVPDSELRRMLDLTGISLTLPTFATVDAATAAVAA